MNYYIEKHNMDIILDAMDMLHQHMQHYGNDGYPYSITDVQYLVGYLMGLGQND